MAYEGLKMNHCVATYVTSVNNGHCAIFSLDDATLEIGLTHSKGIVLRQLKTFANKNVPEALYNGVKNKIDEYNQIVGVDVTEITKCETIDYLPF